MTPRERADRAKIILEDPAFEAALLAIRESLVAKLEQIPISEHETQHEVALMLQLLKRLREQLQQFATEGLIDEHRKKHETFVAKMRQRFA